MTTRPTIDTLIYSKDVMDRARVLRSQEESVYGQNLTTARHQRLIAMNFVDGHNPASTFTPEALAAVELVTLALQVLHGREKLSALAAAAKEIDVLADYLGFNNREDKPLVEKLPSIITGDRAVDPEGVDSGIEESMRKLVADGQ